MSGLAGVVLGTTIDGCRQTRGGELTGVRKIPEDAAGAARTRAHRDLTAAVLAARPRREFRSSRRMVPCASRCRPLALSSARELSSQKNLPATATGIRARKHRL